MLRDSTLMTRMEARISMIYYMDNNGIDDAYGWQGFLNALFHFILSQTHNGY